ncbi:MAG: molybdenum cofactor biosynthesis protein MoaE [Pirellulales bacterium]
MIEVTNHKIDTNKLLADVQSPLAGAVVLFVGTTRQLTDGRETASLDYECHESMTLRQFEKLRQEATRRWPILQCGVIHRIGRVEIGEASIAVAVSSPHRADAFAAASWLMDEIKQQAPIWKRENWADGSSQWVHPGLDGPGENLADTAEDAT